MGQKQGTGNRVYGDAKVEPKSRAVNPGGAANLGGFYGNKTTNGGEINTKVTPLYDGKGYEAPPIRSTNSKGGSQGRY